jgi:parallel beta-helix repeat protein
MNMQLISRRIISHLGLVALLSFIIFIFASSNANANHPVFVEGNCLVSPAGTSSVITNGTCGDYDGDGLIGNDEDNDGDRVFGTITGAITNATTGANQNGRVTIVTSGVFAEVVNITAANGNVQLEAAPGVEAIVDAVLQGDPGSGGRQGAPGIIVDAPDNRRVVIKNIVSRNWTNGIDVRGSSHVVIAKCRVENNANFGILVSDNARVVIKDSHITDTGFRVGATGDFPTTSTPNPGIGIRFDGSSSGVVAHTLVSGSFAAGISGVRGLPKNVQIIDSVIFDNNPDFENVRKVKP